MKRYLEQLLKDNKAFQFIKWSFTALSGVITMAFIYMLEMARA